MAKKTGRPLLKIDLVQLEKLAIMHCTNREIASFFDCSVDTITDRFSDLIEKGKDKGKARLRRAMWQAATEKNHAIMMIFLAKNLLGMSDKIETKSEVKTDANEQLEKLKAVIMDEVRLKIEQE